jgi:integrase/recombinase XerD
LEQRDNAPPYLEELTESDFHAYLHHLHSVAGLKASSRARAQHAFRSFSHYAIKKGWTDGDIAAALSPIRVPTQERVYLTEAEVQRLIKQVDTPLLQLVTLFLYRTGLRISECLALTTETVDLTEGIVYVIDGKGHKDRVVPLAPDVWKALNHYVTAERPAVDTDHFFVSARSGGLSASRVNQALSDAARRLGGKKQVSAHTLRHAFASRLVQQGVNLVAVQKLLGHASLEVTGIYTHVAREELIKAVAALSSPRKEQGKEETCHD